MYRQNVSKKPQNVDRFPARVPTMGEVALLGPAQAFSAFSKAGRL